MKIAIGSDHAGYDLKQELIDLLRADNHDFRDLGTVSGEPVDYPDIAREVSNAVASGEFERGIIICGTGIGVCMTANKIKGIRAALCANEFTARMSREHNDANVLALGGRVIGTELAKAITRVWLKTDFSGEPRHRMRIEKIEQ